MQGTIAAVIFDMDGVLINSEHLWRKAMIAGFNEFGMKVNEEDCRKTMGMRFGEVVGLWLSHFGLKTVPALVETRVMEILLGYIRSEGKVIAHIPELIAYCKSRGLRLGLATSSATVLMDAILTQLGMENTFEAAVSAENLRYGKPHPEVFLHCAEKLGVAPEKCIVIEDSLNGVIAARAARMQVIAVPDDEHAGLQQFAVSDHRMENMADVLAFFKQQFSIPATSGQQPLP